MKVDYSYFIIILLIVFIFVYSSYSGVNETKIKRIDSYSVNNTSVTKSATLPTQSATLPTQSATSSDDSGHKVKFNKQTFIRYIKPDGKKVDFTANITDTRAWTKAV